MSGISGIGSSGNSLSIILQRLDGANSQSGGLSVSGDSNASPLSAMRSKLEASGVDVQKLDSLQDKIKSAVTSAIQNSQNSGGTTDMQQVIQDAVDKTLKDNGIDPNQLKQEMQSAMGGVMPSGGMGDTTTSSIGSMKSSELDALFGDNSSNSNTSASTSKSNNTSGQTNTQLNQTLQDWLKKLLGNQDGTTMNSQLGLLLDGQG